MYRLILYALVTVGAAALDPLDYVNLFIGTHAGYDGDPQYNVTGFSQLHQSGTGGQVPLSNFKLFPIYNDCSAFEQCLTTIDSRKILRNLLPDGSPDDAASPGYFSTNLTNLIRVELTATRRAQETPPNWNIQGRQVDAWKEYGYILSDTTFRGGSNTKQVSRALEYAFDDFTIAQVAKLLDKEDDAAKVVFSRAENFVNSWNSNISVPDIAQNITGFFQPKFANGTWNYTDPRHCSVNDPLKATCFLNAIRRDGFYETSPIVVYVPHDTAELIELQGGTDKFIEGLD
ncbi:hypothetical protein BDZ89DRAFT_1135397 [Hymenopellis radicata]|nr:hypothetical protein BDZ89DRAFT_1135397 [Hymenopellis radicata]